MPEVETITFAHGSQRRSIAKRLSIRLSTWWLRPQFGRCGRECWLEWPSLLLGGKAIHVGDRVHLWHSARLEVLGKEHDGPKLVIGSGTKIGPYVHIGAVKRVEIGSECLFASGIYISDHDHDYSNPDEPVVSNRRLVCAPIVIEDRVWLGERVIVLKGVRIGRGSIVGAGSVVTRSIPPYSVAVGSPARVIRQWSPELREWVAL